MSNCSNLRYLQHSSKLDGSRWKTLIQTGTAISWEQTFHLVSAVLAVSTSMLNTSCWLWEQFSSTLLPCKIKQLTSQVFLTFIYLVTFSHSTTISGTQTKWLLRPEWLTCMLLTEGPSWQVLGPSWEPSMAQDIILCFSIQCTWSNGKAVMQLVSAFITWCWGLLLHAITVCREILGQKLLSWIRFKDQDVETNWWIWEYRSTVSPHLIPIS